MNRILLKVVLALSCFSSTYALAVDTFDGKYLLIPQVQVGSSTYSNVKIAIGQVVSIGYLRFERNRRTVAPNSVSIPTTDTYNATTKQLSIPLVQAFGSVYTNAVVTVGQVISVGGSLNAGVGSLMTAYASTSGSDLNPGTITQPFQTIQACASSLALGGTCFVRAGTYRETVTPNSGTTITNYDNEVVTIDGTDPISPSSWSPHKGSIYKTPITFSSDNLVQIFVGQQMMTQARWPNSYDELNPIWALAASGTSTTALIDPDLPNFDWTGARVHWWSGSDAWVHQTALVTSSSKGQASFTLDGASSLPYIVPQSGGYYYLFGSMSALDAPREWHYDSAEGTLYFWPPSGGNPANLDVRVKQRQFAIDLSGKSNVIIQNLNIFGANIITDSNSSGNTINKVVGTYVSHFSTLPDLMTCAPTYCGSTKGSYWHDWQADSGFVIDGSNNSVLNSTVAYSAGSGITVMGTNHTIKNNLIHHVDYLGNYNSGIVLQGSGHKITNNTIHDAAKFGIYFDGNSGVTYYPSLMPSNIDVGYNNVYASMLSNRDGAAIYTWNTQVSNINIHHNWLHDIYNIYPGPSGIGSSSPLPYSGLYFDTGAQGYSAYQNVVWNTGKHSITVIGNDPTNASNLSINNNSVVDAASSAAIFVWNVQACSSSQISNNYVLTSVNKNTSTCSMVNNSSTAAGASEMISTVSIGCNFAGCTSSSPPTVVSGVVAASIMYQPLSVSVISGSTATFTVVGNGSGALKYQWFKNGVAIVNATTSSYTTPSTSSKDDGTTFTVSVTNSIGSALSSPVILSVL